ncbi:tripartite tricarboxylate transporter permease [Pseudoroseomonas cervicalis]|uniref:tripartite tricarboxylate transporter permease n=1 Tax=Teichococcus cervicalis TaxID=204525 RepID=UPI0022F167C0|nr:tripartite tricarboxylate transporter permease [Pseudoroseomonas cervicalis]WBV45269.1 tripartite tricarboxylate transporter permease [Pseudoroseomonas cervicalis]
MDTFTNLAAGFQIAFTLQNLGYSLLGVFVGNLIGVLPGIGPLAAISILLPVTFGMEPTGALIMLAGIYYGAQYGGATTSILLNIPGVASHAVTCLDGYPMARQGRPGVAIFTSMYSSFIGACIGILIMIFFSPVMVSAALSFGPADYFAMMALGLIAASTLAQGSALKSIAMVVLGLLIGCIGTDVQTGLQRFTAGIPELSDGINLVAVATGMFGLADIFANVNRTEGSILTKGKGLAMRAMFPTGAEFRRITAPILRGTGIGAILGILPGTGGTIASFMSYAFEKRVSRTPERFGKGAIEGIAAPESSNNAAAQTAFIPTLTLGIPGDAVMALMLGALIIFGIQPGPRFPAEHPDIFWSLIASFWIGNLLLVIMNIPLIGLWARLLLVPYRLMYPAILFFICIGVYSINNSLFDVGIALAFGVLGYGMNILGFEAAPLLLGYVLGPLMEEQLRRAMLLSRGDPSVFIERPISATLLAMCAGLVAWTVWSALKTRRPAEEVPAEG